jgi:ankyrin repeat protein
LRKQGRLQARFRPVYSKDHCMKSIACTASTRLVPDAAPATDATTGLPQAPRMYCRVAAPASRKRERELYGARGYEMAIDDLATRLESISLARMSNVDKPYQYRQNLLHAAASADLPAVAAALLDGGARMEYADCSGATALHWALREENNNMALMLLDRGANADHVDNAGYTALILAVRNKSLPVVRRLLDCMSAAAINHLNVEGLSALHAAVLSGLGAMVDLLAKAGAKIDGRSPTGLGLTPLMTAVLAGQCSMTARLLALGAQVRLADNVDNTALHYAVARGFEQIAYQLLCAGAQVDCINTEGTSPVQLALAIGPASMAQLLVGSAAEHLG